MGIWATSLMGGLDQRFLATFTNVRVLSVSSISQKIVFNKDIAMSRAADLIKLLRDK